MKLLCTLLLPAVGIFAQTPAFEVASIKPNRSGGGGSSIRQAKGQLTMENVPLRKMTLWAYGIPDDREYALIGPGWLGTERFDIAAKYPGETPVAQIRQMTQTLLADRFKLALHRETRQLPIFALVVAKGGPKIQATAPGAANTNGGPGHLQATRITMQKLCDLMARMVGQPVTNDTGLAGVFSFTLDWTPDETQKLGAPEDGTAPSGASLFAALQEQLGLRLEGRKGPVDVLVVDRMEKSPTEN
jgi:uncharacterized protein (TIGR03435 family)